MRKLIFISLLIGPVALSYPKDHLYDRDLALAAGKAYVEAYWRIHPELSSVSLIWDRADVVEVLTPDSRDQDAVVGVFFPESAGAGVGFACFVVNGGPDHLIPSAWGQTGNLRKARESFRRHAGTAHCLTDDGML